MCFWVIINRKLKNIWVFKHSFVKNTKCVNNENKNNALTYSTWIIMNHSVLIVTVFEFDPQQCKASVFCFSKNCLGLKVWK